MYDTIILMLAADIEEEEEEAEEDDFIENFYNDYNHRVFLLRC